MAQAVRENGTPFPAPPGLESAASSNADGQGAVSTDLQVAETPEQQALLDEVRRLVLADIDCKVGAKITEIWTKGNNMLKQAERERNQKNAEILAELAACRKKQDDLQAENDALRATITNMAQHLNILGTFFGGPKGNPALAAGLAATGGSNGAASSDAANNSSAASASSLQDSPSGFSIGYEGSFPPLPTVPDFPYSPAPTTSTPLPAAATPLSLAEALGSDSPPSSVPVSLVGSLPATLGQKIFSFTLRKADGTDLGLNVSHHEEDKALRVESVRPEGAVEAWNRQCMGSAASEKAVITGDRIISVNNVSGDPVKMLEECRDNQLLKLTVIRGEAPKATTLRAEASEFVPAGMDTKNEDAEEETEEKEGGLAEECSKVGGS